MYVNRKIHISLQTLASDSVITLCRAVQDRQNTYNVTLWRIRVTIVAGGKVIRITCSDCVFVALGIQHAMHMRRSHLWPASLYNIYLRCLINGTIFERSNLP